MERDPEFWGVSWKLEGDAYDKLHHLAAEEVFKAQSIVFTEGDVSEGMYLVIEGYALVMKHDKATGQDFTIAIVEPGQSFGELGLLTSNPRHGTVAAGTDLKVVKITREVLEKLEANASEVAMALYKTLATTLADQLLTITSRNPTPAE